MQRFLKEFFYYTREQRRGICLLIIGIIVVWIACTGYSAWKKSRPVPTAEIIQESMDKQKCQEFVASLQKENDGNKKFFNSYKDDYRSNTNRRYPNKEEPVVLTNFNPNTADSLTFRRLGLRGWMVKNILHYRSKGGHFRRPEDFKRIYGLTSEEYARLLPYIHLSPQDTTRTAPRLFHPGNKIQEIIKYPEGTLVNLNKADTTELKKIPGIGSGIARMIIGYRQRLGGYYKIEQLDEIHLDSKMIRKWFEVNPGEIHRINLNRAGIDRLRHHPYINFYQAKAIVEYRRKNSTINSLKPFSLYEEFTPNDLERISPYVCFK